MYWNAFSSQLAGNCTNGQKIEIQSWLAPDKQMTTRKVQTVFDLISNVGGLSGFLSQIFGIVVSLFSSNSMLYVLLPQLFVVKTKRIREHRFKRE